MTVQRLALFDLDNTLIDLNAAFRDWAAEFALDRQLGADAFEWLLAIDKAGHPHRAEFFATIRERFTLAESVEGLWAQYRTRMPYLVHCRAAILDGLTALRASGWSIGIVTNGMADNQLGKIQRTGLVDVVDAWAISGAEGIRKPDIRLFEIAGQRCGKSLTDGGWVIGDSLTSDIDGGNKAGLRTIWINYQTVSDLDHAAHHAVHRVEDALKLLRDATAP
ncbi:HAD family hydrolase [Acrocarpospora catenulata]|uniref:HAD family hydrolase n=1 Tax=Acrocarpospora catenulata TaxID=2836182 RepID=UPI0027DF8FD2|nr:HAD family hydrolase [Acrocarpospora catenulata]